MNFTELLTPDHVRQGACCSSKKTLFEMLAEMVETQQPEIAEHCQCFNGLFSREKLGCTAVGGGVAMPRAKLPAEAKPMFAFLQLAEPLDYDAPDKRKVDLILAAFIPEGQCESYVEVLFDFAEKLADKNLCKQLRAAQSADEIWQIFEHTDKYLSEEIAEN